MGDTHDCLTRMHSLDCAEPTVSGARLHGADGRRCVRRLNASVDAGLSSCVNNENTFSRKMTSLPLCE